MTRRNYLRFLLRTLSSIVLLMVMCSLPALAQSTSATLSGTIEDEQGAVIPGVQVTVENPATTFRREATANSQGYFTIPLLQPGTYLVTARRDGFAPVQYKDVVLNVGDQKALNIQLKAGDVNATVTVDSSAETVRTDGSVGTVINRQQIANMPLNGRTLQSLIQLTPGIVLTTASSGGGSTGSGQFSVNGQRTTANYFMVDGISANTGMATSNGGFPGASGSGQTPGTTALGGTNSLVSLDALQEFRIETSTFAPEFGRTPGGQISLVTRGGTNSFHGNASYYLRNEALDANDWFLNRSGQGKPKERQSFFGGVIGGPIKQNRLFFFASYEGLRLEQPQAAVTIVPSLNLRAQASTELRHLVNAFPQPNGQDFGDGTAEFTAGYSDPSAFNIFALRFDGRLSERLTAFFRINHAPSEKRSRGGSLSLVGSVEALNDSYTGGVTWVKGSRVTADVRANWTRNQARTINDLDTFGGAIVPNVGDIFAPGRDPSKAAFLFDGPAYGLSWGPGTSDAQRQFNFVGTVAWVAGPHQLKFGADYRRNVPLFGGTGGLLESLFFESTEAILNKQATLYQITSTDMSPRQAVITNLSLFAQDTWQMSRRLTLTYGARFEHVPSPDEANGKLPRTVLGIESDPPQNPRLAPKGTPLFHSRVGVVAPRFGVSYQLRSHPDWQTTIRGGFGTFYDLGLGDIAGAFQNIYPFFASSLVFDVPYPLSNAIRTPPALGVDAPQQFILLDPELKMPYTMQWNATWEQALGRAQLVTVSYVGAAGRRLLGKENYNQILAGWSDPITLSIQRNLSRSSYKALQIQYQRRLSAGLQAVASYTLGHSEDNISANNTTATPIGRRDLLDQEWGPSDFDVRHIFSAAVSYDLPKFSGHGPGSIFLKDWGVDLLLRYQSAFPFSPVTGTVLLPNGVRITRRPNLISGVPIYVDVPNAPGGRVINSAPPTAAQIASAGCVASGAAKGAFCTPPSGQQGNFHRNGLRGFSATQVDLALRREIGLSERIKLQVRGELFNLFNHPNFSIPSNSITSGSFGQPTSMLNRSLGGLNALYQMGGPRSAQLSLKIIF